MYIKLFMNLRELLLTINAYFQIYPLNNHTESVCQVNAKKKKINKSLSKIKSLPGNLMKLFLN